MKLGEALTWDDLANDYGRGARARPMQEVFDWAARQTDRYYLDSEEGTLHRILHKAEGGTDDANE